MDRVRGGVFSGAMVLAGISATLLSALLAIGIRQMTVQADSPLQVTMVPSSGEVAVPDVTPTPRPSHPAPPTSAPAYAPLPHGYLPARSGSEPTAGSTAGSRTAGGTVAKPTPPAGARRSPSVAPSPSRPGHGNGHAKGAGKGNGHKR